MTADILDSFRWQVFSIKPIRSGKTLALLFCLVMILWPRPCVSSEESPITVAGQPAPEERPQFYHDAKRGWFWYEKPAPEPEKTKKDENESRPIPALQDYAMEELWDMHPDDFQALLMAFQKKAVQRPSEENVRDYLTMQDIARRKAAAYANVASYVLQKNASLDLGRDYPVTAPGVVARIRMQNEEVSRTIAAAREDHALLYFTSQTCPYCTEQRQILGFFTDRYGWQVKPIDIEAEPVVAARFGVATTPTLLLISRNRQDYLNVAAGVVSLDELEQKLYRAVRLLSGAISPEEYSVYDFQKGGGFDPNALLKK